MKILKISGIIIAVFVVVVAGVLIYITNHLPSIPVQDIKVEVTPERVEKGRYLANNVFVCMDCHSTRQWDKYAGPMKPGSDGNGGETFGREMGLPGKYVASNLTPYNLKDWSDGEIFRAITSGVGKGDRPLFPIMPYMSYGRLAKEDIYSVIAYLRTLPEIKNDTEPSESDFPMSVIIHMIPQEPNLQEKPDPSDVINYGKYLVTGAGCADCHTPMKDGKPVEGMTFAGGQEFPLPFGTLRTPNITPDNETGIGIWSKENFIDKFKSFELSNYQPENVTLNEFNTIMPWTMYAGMDSTDLAAIYDYLRTIKPIKHQVERAEFRN